MKIVWVISRIFSFKHNFLYFNNKHSRLIILMRDSNMVIAYFYRKENLFRCPEKSPRKIYSLKWNLVAVRNASRESKFHSMKKIHDNFWNHGDYQCVNVLINLISKKSSLTRTGNALKKFPERWKYTFPTGTDHVVVCKIFLCNVLGIDKSRIENVQ